MDHNIIITSECVHRLLKKVYDIKRVNNYYAIKFFIEVKLS